MIRYLFALFIFAHGIGHALFLANTWGYWRTGAGRAALFSKIPGVSQEIERVFGLAWLLPAIGFLAMTWGVLANEAWWPSIGLLSAVVSLGFALLWWGGLNTSSAIFALIFDLAVIAVIWWQSRA